MPAFFVSSCLCGETYSEIHAQAEHDDPGTIGLRNSAETRAIDIGIRTVELRGIEHVDEISAHLQLLVFANTNVFDQIRVKPEDARSLQVSLRKRAESTRRRINRNSL